MIEFLKKHRHYGTASLFAMLAASAVLDWLPLSHGLLKTFGYLLMPLTMVGIIVTRAHDRGGLCEDCAKVTPLDPQAAVDRHRPWLKSFHTLHDSQKRFAIGAYTFLALIVVSALIFKPYTVGATLTTDFTCLVVALLLLSSTMHRRLMPWCPWCHWDGHGEHERTPDVPKVPVGA